MLMFNQELQPTVFGLMLAYSQVAAVFHVWIQSQQDKYNEKTIKKV